MEATIPSADAAGWPGLSPAARDWLGARFDLLGELGRGGMAVVFQARHRTLDRLVARKVTLPGLSVSRFLREARLAAQVRSPHVVTVHDCEILPDGQPLLVLEYVPGCNLAQVLTRAARPLDEAAVLPWMRQVALGMQAAADLGIVHRDLKPSNILLSTPPPAQPFSREPPASADAADAVGGALPRGSRLNVDGGRGGEGPVKVADFGLACCREGPGSQTLTGDGLMGTPFYMAPEQAEDPHNVDTRADVYSFGATFYHALTGVTPFAGKTAFSVLFRHKTEPLIPPRTRNPALSARLGEVLERCLAKAPSDRFASFTEVLRQLDATGQESPWDALDDPALAPYLARYHQRRPVYLERLDQFAQPDAYDFPGGR